MRIGIDARQISHKKKHGLRTYVENLVNALSVIDTKNEYILFLDQKDTFDLSHLNDNFTLEILPWHIKYVSTLINDHYYLPKLSHCFSLDLIHYPANCVNFSNSLNTVVTVHDAIPFMALRDSSRKQDIIPFCIAYYNVLLIKNKCKNASRVITISKKSRSDLIDCMGLNPKKFKVTYLAANEQFKKVLNSKDINTVKAMYNLGGQFVLGFAHKNGAKIVQAFFHLPDSVTSKTKLGLICLTNSFPDEVQNIVSQHRLRHRIICIPPVSEKELVLLYNSASLFVFPSYYEGFGLPVLEAMRCGCPVICSKRGSLPEVAGEATLFVNELDDNAICIQELSHKINKVLTKKSLRDKLVEKGSIQAYKFDWKKTAIETLSIYEEAFEAKK